MCLQGDGDALAASDLRDKVRRLEVNMNLQTLLLLVLLLAVLLLRLSHCCCCYQATYFMQQQVSNSTAIVASLKLHIHSDQAV
jgi:hypothetical protein